MDEIREAFLESSRVALALLERAEVAVAWERPSALEHMSVGELCGHLFRASGSVAAYLDREPPTGRIVSPAEYYAAALDDPEQSGSAPDLMSDLHQAIRQRSATEAERGHAGLVEAWRDLLDGLALRLEAEPEDRTVEVFKGLGLLLDDYLVTRMIELVVHCDDLAVSVGSPPVDMPALASDVAIEALVSVAVLRHGGVAVLRALARRERDSVEALRVL
jgi:hypothetical protein